MRSGKLKLVGNTVLLFLISTTNVWAAAHRAIALSPAITEMIYTLQLQDNLIGVSEFSDFPEEAKKKKVVGGYTKPNMEKIIMLKPDVVFLPIEGTESVREQFDRLKIPYLVLDMRSLKGIGDVALEVATRLGNKNAGVKFQKAWESQLQEAFSHAKRNGIELTPKTIIEIQAEPLIVAGHDTFLDEIVHKCGGNNIFSNRGGYPRVSLELLINQKIDLVFIAEYFGNDELKKTVLEKWKKFPATKASKLIWLDANTASRPGPRLIGAVKQICSAVKEATGAHAK